MKTLLKNGYVVTMDPEKGVLTRGYVLVEDDLIKAVESGEAPAGIFDEVIDCDGKIIMPGLINTHVHTSQQLGRGLGDDVNLLTWLHDRIWPYESNMTEDDSYISTLLCCAARTVEDIKNFHNTADGRVQVWFGLRTIFNNSDELILRSKEMADRYGVGVHMQAHDVAYDASRPQRRIAIPGGAVALAWRKIPLFAMTGEGPRRVQ